MKEAGNYDSRKGRKKNFIKKKKEKETSKQAPNTEVLKLTGKIKHLNSDVSISCWLKK